MLHFQWRKQKMLLVLLVQMEQFCMYTVRNNVSKKQVIFQKSNKLNVNKCTTFFTERIYP